MVVIKGKEKRLTKPMTAFEKQLSEKAKKKLRRPQDNQPIPTVAV